MRHARTVPPNGWPTVSQPPWAEDLAGITAVVGVSVLRTRRARP
ncbi:hypothetical protein [Streptomyces thermolilacinus]|nr:hypothetical protein [Streptomyces thermolilacinus]